MQQVGSSTTDNFLLHHLNSSDCGSETSAEPRKSKARAQKESADLSRMRPNVSFYMFYLLLLGLGVACMTCVCYWITQWQGGFAWDGTHQQFNWHPALMVTGLVVFYGYGAVLYRVPLTWGQNKLPWKLLHATLMLLALLLSIVGLCAVFGFHYAENIPNVYSLHSWIGIAATALFALQWVVGAVAFLLPCSPTSLRKLLKPAHVWLGGSIFSLSIMACISGINEKLFFALKGGANSSAAYSSLPPEAVFANSLGVLIVAFGLVVLLILSIRRWQRPESMPAEVVYSPLHQDDN